MNASYFSLRHRIGRLKFYLQVSTYGKYLRARATAVRNSNINPIDILPTVTLTPLGDCDIVMVCGVAEIEMATWALWSCVRFINNVGAVIILDGDVAEKDIQAIRTLVDGVRIIHREEADKRVSEKLRSFPNILKWRQVNRTGRKLADPHLSSSARKVLVIDTDVLCFSTPKALVEAINNPDVSYTWNSDFAYSYVAPQTVLFSILKRSIPILVNSGLMLHPRSTEDTFTYVEELLGLIKDDGRINFSDRWFEQTIAAACVDRFGPNSQPLPPEYSVHSGSTPHSCSMRHFVGSPLVRPRFYCEGIPRLLDGLAH